MQEAWSETRTSTQAKRAKGSAMRHPADWSVPLAVATHVEGSLLLPVFFFAAPGSEQPVHQLLLGELQQVSPAALELKKRDKIYKRG